MLTLPNGYGELPLVRICPHANSCLTCPMFVTTAEFLPQHHAQRQQTLQIISAAESSGHARVAEMNRQVASNLDKIISSLEDDGEERRKPPARRERPAGDTVHDGTPQVTTPVDTSAQDNQGRQRQHHLIHPAQAPLPLFDQLERDPVARRLSRLDQVAGSQRRARSPSPRSVRRYTTLRPALLPITTPVSRRTARCALTVPSESPNVTAS
jgi:hypothetical protein